MIDEATRDALRTLARVLRDNPPLTVREPVTIPAQVIVQMPREVQIDPESSGSAADRLRSLVDQIENLDADRKAISSEIKVLRRLLPTRKQDAAEVEQKETMLDMYRRADHVSTTNGNRMRHTDAPLRPGRQADGSLSPAGSPVPVVPIVERARIKRQAIIKRRLNLLRPERTMPCVK